MFIIRSKRAVTLQVVARLSKPFLPIKSWEKGDLAKTEAVLIYSSNISSFNLFQVIADFG